MTAKADKEGIVALLTILALLEIFLMVASAHSVFGASQALHWGKATMFLWAIPVSFACVAMVVVPVVALHKLIYSVLYKE